MADMLWDDEDIYWRQNYSKRPYASNRAYDALQPGYRYGFDAASRYRGRKWTEIEKDLERDWDSYPNRGGSTWQHIKDAVHDAWERVTGGRG
jgi:hypothetical protein